MLFLMHIASHSFFPFLGGNTPSTRNTVFGNILQCPERNLKHTSLPSTSNRVSDDTYPAFPKASFGCGVLEPMMERLEEDDGGG